MTIPTLIQRTQEKIAVTRLKKTYSTFESAFRLATIDKGSPENWNLGAPSPESQGAEDLLNILEPYLKISKKCGKEAGCYFGKSYKYLKKSGTESPDDGMALESYFHD